MSSFDLTSRLSVTGQGTMASVAQPARSGEGMYSSPAEEAAAALVHLSGASSITVAQFETGIPPNLAAASSLVDQLSATAGDGVIPAAFASLYTLMDPEAALALVSD